MPDRGRGGKKNFPAARMPEADKDTSHIINCIMYGYQLPKVRSDDELQQRFVDYFRFCADNDILPTIEAMFLFTGYSVSGMHDMLSGRRKGFSPETAEIIKKAKDFMRVFDAQLVISGKLNPVTYIFRAKNYYGMTDQQQITVAPQTTIAIEGLSQEEISKRLLAATIDTTLSDYDPATMDKPPEE